MHDSKNLNKNRKGRKRRQERDKEIAIAPFASLCYGFDFYVCNGKTFVLFCKDSASERLAVAIITAKRMPSKALQNAQIQACKYLLP